MSKIRKKEFNKIARDIWNQSARERHAGPFKQKRDKWSKSGWRDGVLDAEGDDINPAEILSEADEIELKELMASIGKKDNGTN